MINAKKLDLTEAKRMSLISSLAATAARLDADGRRIYDSTIEAVRSARGRIYLTAAQVEITCFALRAALANDLAGLDKTQAGDMLAQLTMTRKAYAERAVA